jgi:hypothetical protein
MVVKCSEIHGIAKCVTCLGKGAARVAKHTFTPSLLSYFLWSGIIYVACGSFAILEWYPIYDLFCDMPAREKGCDNCADNLLMCPKTLYPAGLCWADAVNKTYQEEAADADGRYFETMQLAVQDQNCNSLVKASTDPIDMILAINGSTTMSDTSACMQWNCRVLAMAFDQVSECDVLCSTTDTNVTTFSGTSVPVSWLTKMCGVHAPGLDRLVKDRCLKSSGRLLRPADHGVPGPWHKPARQRQEVEERRLTGDSTTSSFLGGSGDWEVSGWSSCTCLQQCTAGVRTRFATCLSGNCDPAHKPAEVEKCECWHCARCTVRWSILGFSAGYFFQGACSLLLWLAFARVSYLDEEDLTHISFSMKLLGGICKILPRIVRFCALVAFGFILLLIGQSFLPSGEMNVACKQNGKLQVMAILITLCWVMQIIIGVFMKKRSPMPAYLFNARRPGVMRKLCRPVRAIGP